MSHAAASAKTASGRPSLWYIRSTFLTMFLPNAIVIDSVSWVYLYHYEVRVCLDGLPVAVRKRSLPFLLPFSCAQYCTRNLKETIVYILPCTHNFSDFISI